MRIRKKDKVLFLLIGILVLMGIGYAYLNTNLSIDGVSNVKSSNWNVHFENAVVSSGSVPATAGPTIDTNASSVSYTTTLSQPGDYFEFTVDAKNSGTIDAMIDSISTTVNGNSISSLPNYLEYSITYEDGIPVGQYHLLEAGSSLKYKIKINYITDIDASDLPSADQSLRVISTINYKQADNNAFDRPIQGYSYYQPTGSDGFKHISIKTKEDENHNLLEGYIGVKVGNKFCYAQVGDSSYYESNKQKMLDSFGENNCRVYSANIYCEIGYYSLSADDSGDVSADYSDPVDSCNSKSYSINPGPPWYFYIDSYC